jgi:hypothetical protein
MLRNVYVSILGAKTGWFCSLTYGAAKLPAGYARDVTLPGGHGDHQEEWREWEE